MLSYSICHGISCYLYFSCFLFLFQFFFSLLHRLTARHHTQQLGHHLRLIGIAAKIADHAAARLRVHAGDVEVDVVVVVCCFSGFRSDILEMQKNNKTSIQPKHRQQIYILFFLLW